MSTTFRIWRGDATKGEFKDYTAEAGEGMVVLDAVHQIQATQAPDLACRWNCKAGKCGSCSAEINGMPRLMCMTRLDDLPPDEIVIVEPMQAFPLVKDLVTDVSWNYEVKKRIKPFRPRKPDNPDGTWKMAQEDADRVQEFRKCIECFLCQDVCHVLRDHHKHDEFIGPRHLVYVASLEMNPLDTADRIPELKEKQGLGLLQHHQVLHQGLPGAHHHHRQRDHPAEGARRRRVLRPGDEADSTRLPTAQEGRADGDEARLSSPLAASREVCAMTFELKSLRRDAIPAALEKAHRYRLLNEPEQAESICEDVLRLDPENQAAVASLILALTDRFGSSRPVLLRRVRDLLPRLSGEYERAYYAGIIDEREGVAWLRSGLPRSGEAAYMCFRDAMKHFEKAEALCPPANDDPLLRWNSCARMIMNHPSVAPPEEVATQLDVGD